MTNAVRCILLAFFCLNLSSLGEAAFGETFPHVMNARLGRGFHMDSKSIKEFMLLENYTREVVNVTKSVSKYTFIEDDSDVSKVLDMSGEIKFGINVGFSLKVDGKAHYVRDQQVKDSDIQLLFSLNVLDYYEIAPKIEAEGRQDCSRLRDDAGLVSHVVGGILYGAQCTVSLVWKAKNDVERRKIMGELNLQLGKRGKFNVEVGGNVEFNNSAQKATHNYDLKASCNMELGKFPKSMQEIASFAEGLPKIYFKQKKEGNPRGVPISMYLVPLKEVASCRRLAMAQKPAIPPAPTVVDFVFTELENMLTDYNGAKEILSKCHRQYPLRGFDDADIYYLEASFYHIKRAINRRAVLLKQLLIDSKPGDETKWNDPEQLLTFIDRFEQKYFDFVIAPVDKEVYNVIDKLGNNLRVVVEGHHLEGRVRVRRNLVGNKVWRLRAQALCDQRHHLSDIWREEF